MILDAGYLHREQQRRVTVLHAITPMRGAA